MKQPTLSFILIFHNMQREARQTLHSLSSRYQMGVSEDSYEVICVDNNSSEPLDGDYVRSFGKNFHYVFHKTDSKSPVGAINEAVKQSSGEYVGICIDGAHILTPGIIARSLQAIGALHNPMIIVLQGNLGRSWQNISMRLGYDKPLEDTILDTCQWRNDGYNLFNVSCAAASSGEGWFGNFSETNCLILSRSTFNQLGGFDTRFQSPGGGLANLDIFRRAISLTDVNPVVLLGEATFHQFHGGISTNIPLNEHPWDRLAEEYKQIRGEDYAPPSLKPFYFGKVPPQALTLLPSEAPRTRHLLEQKEAELGQLRQQLAESHARLAASQLNAVEAAPAAIPLPQMVTDPTDHPDAAAFQTSTSWRITAPMRGFKRALQRFRPVLGKYAYSLYGALPLPAPVKLGGKSFVFALFSPLLRNRASYRAWIRFEEEKLSETIATPVASPAPQILLEPAGLDVTASQSASLDICHTEADFLGSSPVDTEVNGQEIAFLHPLLNYVDECHGTEAARLISEIVATYRLACSDSSDPALRSEFANNLEGILSRLNHLAEDGRIGENPDVSVIIPTFNQPYHTLACIHSVLAWPCAYPCEIIIADDCSTDPLLLGALAALKGVRVIRPETNLGFLRNCNHAAQFASGRFLLFLNNDTLVLPGWINELMHTFASQDKAGIVGAKLLFRDGSLQEAGGLIWCDASGWNFGRNDDPRKPEYNYLRDVDYCSGAAIMIPKGLFFQLGAFDERYSPAYYEDTDLAFSVRDYGYRCIYQPLSQVIHFEGVSSGTDLNSGVKSHQVRNQFLFQDKWKDLLAAHRRPHHEPHFEKERHVQLRILILDEITPKPDCDSGSVDAFNHMLILSQLGHKVTFLPVSELEHKQRYTTDLQRIGVECLYRPFVSSVEEHLKSAGHLYDLTILTRVTVAERFLDLVRSCCTGSKIVFEAVDLYHLREYRLAQLKGCSESTQLASLRKETELDVVKRADCTLVLSQFEVDYLQEQVPGSNVARIPLIISIEDRVKVPFHERRDLFFLGNFAFHPNIDAMEYFVAEVWPHIHRSLPAANFFLVGSHLPEGLRRLEGNGVVVLGHVQDLAPVFNRARLSVAPLRYGAGLKGKVGRSCGYGLPLVATGTAVEGSGLIHEEHVLVADDPQAFAAEVVRLYQDDALWAKLSENCLQFFDQNFSLATGRTHFANLVQHLIEQAPSGDPETLGFPEFTSKKAYEVWLRRGRTLVEEPPRDLLEQIRTEQPFDLAGHCFVCNRPTIFHVDFEHSWTGPDGTKIPNWRERLACPLCALNCRMRTAIHVWKSKFKPLETDAVYVTEQTTPLFRWLSHHFRNVVGSEYLGSSTPYGTVTSSGIRNESLLALSFPDDSFDFVLSFDVLEHVPAYVEALRQCYRILKPGGVLVFSVPFLTDSDTTVIRARVNADGEIEHLLPAEYHGDPVNEAGCLCFYHFGWDLLQTLENVGYSEYRAHGAYSKAYGYLGNNLIFSAKKPEIERTRTALN